MVYQHKRKTYAKKTKDILAEEVTDSKKTEYDEIEPLESGQTGSSLLDVIQEHGQNELQGDSEELSADAKEEVDVATNSMIAEDCPDYSSTQEIHFESKEAKETFEKKKKRNYVEFREERNK